MSDDKLREAAQAAVDAAQGPSTASLTAAMVRLDKALKALSPDTGNDHVPAFARGGHESDGHWFWKNGGVSCCVTVQTLEYARTLEKRLDVQAAQIDTQTIIINSMADHVDKLVDKCL